VRAIEVPNPIKYAATANEAHPFDFKKPWLFVNPTEAKGLAFVLELAKALPDQKFYSFFTGPIKKFPRLGPQILIAFPTKKSE